MRTEIQNYDDHVCLGVFANKEDAINMAIASALCPEHVIKEHNVIE